VAVYSHQWPRVRACPRTSAISPPLLFHLQIQAFAELHGVVAITWHSACD
jgi:hypothetical protein